jgi:hypothetical protein
MKSINKISGLFTMLLIATAAPGKKLMSGPSSGDTWRAGYVARVQTGSAITEIEYDDNLTIKSINYKSEKDSPGSRILFHYKDNKLARVDEEKGYFNYSYAGDKVSEINYFNKKGQVSQKYKYSYSGNDISEMISYVNSGGGFQLCSKSVYTYSHQGNVSKEESFSYENGAWRKIGDVLTTEYDTHINFTPLLDNYPYLPALDSPGNNPLKKQFTDATGKVIYTMEYSYTYDSDGRPVSRKSEGSAPGLAKLVTNSFFSYYS